MRTIFLIAFHFMTAIVFSQEINQLTREEFSQIKIGEELFSGIYKYSENLQWMEVHLFTDLDKTFTSEPGIRWEIWSGNVTNPEISLSYSCNEITGDRNDCNLDYTSIKSPKFPLTIKGKTYKVGDPETVLSGLKYQDGVEWFTREYIFDDNYHEATAFIIIVESHKIAEIKFVVYD